MTKIAIFGASSRIARDFLSNIIRYSDHECTLFGRSLKSLENISENTKNFPLFLYENFKKEENFDIVINFIGSGDPKRTLEIGKNILEFTKYFDEMVLHYLSKNSLCKYIFISSGAVYNSDFVEPIGNENELPLELSEENWYALSKQFAELRHRSLPNLKIIDLRIFNYISASIDINGNFLITDILRSFIRNQIFHTSNDNIFRDFISDIDFYHLIDSLINSKELTNCSIDVKSSAPIGKLEMLEALKRIFKLKYKISNKPYGINATGLKKYYFSQRSYPEFLDFEPKYSSIENVIHVFNEVLKN